MSNDPSDFKYRYLCSMRYDQYADTKILTPYPFRYQLCKKCAKKLPSGKKAETILPNKLFEI